MKFTEILPFASNEKIGFSVQVSDPGIIHVEFRGIEIYFVRWDIPSRSHFWWVICLLIKNTDDGLIKPENN